MKKPKSRRAEAAEKMAELVKGVGKRPWLSQQELSIEEEKRKMGQELLDEKLAALPPENDRPKSCPRCGKNARLRRKGVERTFNSLSGTHTIHRNYHYCEICKKGFYPRDALLGLPEVGELSVELEKRVADFTVNDTYDIAERRWNVHYAHRMSANQFRQVAKRLGQQIEECNPIVLQSALSPPETASSNTLYVMNDGGMVPMREGKWNEVKVGVMFREENHLSHREAKRGHLVHPRYVAVLGEQEEFKEALQTAYRVENGVAAKRVVWVGDGALGNWNLASTIAPNAIHILDVQHAIEKGMDCGKVLLGEHSDYLPLWKTRIEQLVYTSDPEALVAELMACLEGAETEAALSAINDLVRYYRNNAGRMQYAKYLGMGLLIGSGIVESAHRHVIQMRMKRAGQHWGIRGGRQMARLRAAYSTAGPERFYDSIHWAYRESSRLQLPAQRPRRRASNR